MRDSTSPNARPSSPPCFQEAFPERPVIVLEPGLLRQERRAKYYHIMAGPIEGAVRDARKQLDQSPKGNQRKHARSILARH